MNDWAVAFLALAGIAAGLYLGNLAVSFLPV